MFLEICIFVLFLLFLLTVLLFLSYCGLFDAVQVKVGPSTVPISGRTVVYRVARGDYSKSGHLFTELTGDLVRVQPHASDLPMIGFYFDDVETKAVEKLRYAVGVILPLDDADLSNEITTALQAKDYKIVILPTIDHVVHVTFPNRGPIGVVIATKRVYPVLYSYIAEHRLCAHPSLEIYSGDNIHFVLPLSKQDSFYLVQDDDDDDVDEDASDSESRDEDAEGGDSDRCSNSEVRFCRIQRILNLETFFHLQI